MNEFYQDQNVMSFREHGTTEYFLRIDPRFRALALSEMLLRQDGYNEEHRESYVVVDRDSLTKKFIEGADSAVREGIYVNAFQMAVRQGATEVARDLYLKKMAGHPELAREGICGALHAISSNNFSADIHSQHLSDEKNKVLELIPLIARNSQLAQASCRFEGDDDRSEVYSIANLLTMASSDYYQKLQQQISRYNTDTNQLIREYSSCSEKQIRYNIFHALQPLKKSKVGSSQYVIVQDDKCVINGLIKKKAQGFDFFPSNGIAGYLKKSFQFNDLETLVSLMKVNQPSYVITTVKPAPAVKVPLLQPTKPAAAEDPTVGSILSSPFSSLKSFFN